MSPELLTRWNEENPPGTPVILRLPDGSRIKTETRSVAWPTPSRVVVLVDEVGGGCDLDAIEVIPRKRSRPAPCVTCAKPAEPMATVRDNPAPRHPIRRLARAPKAPSYSESWVACPTCGLFQPVGKCRHLNCRR